VQKPVGQSRKNHAAIIPALGSTRQYSERINQNITGQAARHYFTVSRKFPCCYGKLRRLMLQLIIRLLQPDVTKLRAVLNKINRPRTNRNYPENRPYLPL